MRKNLKAIFVGPSGVGKSSLIRKLVNNPSVLDYDLSTGVGFAIRDFQCEGKTIPLAVWDAPGHENFQSSVRAYYPGVQLAVVVIDYTQIHSLATFNCFLAYLRAADGLPQAATLCVLVNKGDLQIESNPLPTLQAKQTYAIEQVQQWLKQCGEDVSRVPVYFCSAETDDQNTVHEMLAPSVIQAANAAGFLQPRQRSAVATQQPYKGRFGHFFGSTPPAQWAQHEPVNHDEQITDNTDADAPEVPSV